MGDVLTSEEEEEGATLDAAVKLIFYFKCKVVCAGLAKSNVI